MTTIGILGTGHLAEFLIRGAAGKGFGFLVAPSRRAKTLGARPDVTLAASNQQVVDGADLVLVCLPARDGLAILQTLRFHAGQSVLSAMAGTRLAPLAAAVGPAAAHCTMMPGHANAYGAGPCLLYPADPAWHAFLATLGPVHGFTDETAFVTATAFGALSGASFFLMDSLTRWFAANGMDGSDARRLIAETLIGNATVLLNETASLAEITPGIATPGGITEALVRALGAKGALDAWHPALDIVLTRVRGES
ncbi:pyrroline-5-carboxylate reductase dimerization domain-containing protein [Paragemmobacter straminiformis]|uniref:NAD(P)-binding domain-containing protein n=1 Tax=Paragemmobacter straminiformis TaxID=2045119 RepID=A0A842I6D3_9RHOB|nr:pyrroline-5-carboxylate reductase dimerization domain-containing protein [Gemmobacter straminiformis]MBC2835186.1 NAD(P)-binding domain-containing protein [Gemmobacter straminiformis]